MRILVPQGPTRSGRKLVCIRRTRQTRICRKYMGETAVAVYGSNTVATLLPWHTNNTVKVPHKPQRVNYRLNPISLVTGRGLLSQLWPPPRYWQRARAPESLLFVWKR